MAKKKEENTDKKPSGEKTSENKEDGKQTLSSDERIIQLEKKLGEQGKQLEQQGQFVKTASGIINTLAYTPELKAAWDKKAKEVVGAGQVPGQQPQQVPPQAAPTGQPAPTGQASDKKIDEVEASQRNQIVENFETKYGIDKMKPEEAAETRKKIEGFLNKFGWEVRSAPLSRLSESLNSAYTATHAEKLREEGKLEGLVAARENQAGKMAAISGGAPQSSPEGQLTAGQKDWAKKLKVDEKGAAEAYSARDDERDRVSPAEQKAEELK